MTEVLGYRRFLIGSAWSDPQDSSDYVVVSPGTGSPIGMVQLAGANDIARAVAAAQTAHDSRIWCDLPVGRRADYIRAAKDYCATQIQRMIELSADELGIPIAQSTGRIHQALTFFDDAIELAKMMDRPELRPDPSTGRVALVTREPVGVVAAITPFNSPFAMGVNKTARALMAGCPVVYKPSPEGALLTEVLAEAYAAAGFPAGVVSVLPGDAAAGHSLVSHPAVSMVTFTGSTTGGRAIAKACADNFTRSSLELGGKSAAIICHDADLDVVMKHLPLGTFGKAGQVCVALTRIYVHRSVHDELVERLTMEMRKFVPGDLRDKSTTHGPVISRRQIERIENLVREAIAGGARAAMGGSRYDRDGFFFEPTLLTGVHNGMPVVQEEIFGPVGVLMPFDDEDQAVSLANDSKFGLHGAVFTRDETRGLALSRKIRTGTLALNGYGILANSPFGGVKWSGWGRENGPEGMEDYYEFKSTSLEPSAAARYEQHLGRP